MLIYIEPNHFFDNLVPIRKELALESVWVEGDNRRKPPLFFPNFSVGIKF
jgi:hypothetical protein